MRPNIKKVLMVIMLMTVFLTSDQVMTYAQSQGDYPAVAKEKWSDSVPDLSDITPLAAQLSGRLKALENQIVKLSPDVAKFEKKLAIVEENLKRPADQLSQLKASNVYDAKNLLTVREDIKTGSQLFNEISNPLKKNIRQLGMLRKEWLAEKKQWNEWQSVMVQEGTFDQLKPAFLKANHSIAAALNLILPQLKTMLAMQEKAGNIQEKIYTFDEEVNALITTRRRIALADKFAPVLSTKYFHQFKVELSSEAKKGIDAILWPGSRFFSRAGWVMFLHGFLSIFLIITIFRSHMVLKGRKNWEFVAARPYSVAIFAGCMATWGLYDLVGVIDMWRLVLTIASLTSLSRLVGAVSKSPENTQFVYGLVIALIVTKLLELVSLPLPLFRLLLILATLVGVFLCLGLAEKSKRKGLYFYAWVYRMFSLFLVFIMLAEFSGRTGLAIYLLISLMSTVVIIIGYVFFRHLIHGMLEWIFKTSLRPSAEASDNDTINISRHVAVIFDIILWGLLFIPSILLIWKVYETLGEAIKGFLSFGIELGSQRVSIGLLATSAGILYGTLVVSWIIQKLFIDKMLAKRQMEIGVRHAIEKLIHYVMVFVGFLLAISALGLEITKLTIMLSALGVGIGFGLQSIVNNFVSGIILLFERPVRVGDIIEIGGKGAVIKRIGLRSTIVTTFDGADLVIPNANMVSNEVTNWTLSSRRARIQIPVGVAYGSDITLVIETLTTCGRENQWVAKSPDPQVLFLRFGESSLEFELRVWVFDFEKRMTARSEIHQEIDRRFRELKIEIAFPQRDLHLRTISEPVNLRSSELKK